MATLEDRVGGRLINPDSSKKGNTALEFHMSSRIAPGDEPFSFNLDRLISAGKRPDGFVRDLESKVGSKGIEPDLICGVEPYGYKLGASLARMLGTPHITFQKNDQGEGSLGELPEGTPPTNALIVDLSLAGPARLLEASSRLKAVGVVKTSALVVVSFQRAQALEKLKDAGLTVISLTTAQKVVNLPEFAATFPSKVEICRSWFRQNGNGHRA